MLRIGSYNIGSHTVLAPMAGISDLPFRSMCSNLGAGLVVNEMVTSDTRLWNSQKSQTRLSWGAGFSSNATSSPSNPINGPRSIQIAGSDPQQMANAAQACVNLGAQIIDINMGCPAKKVCNKAAGSALLKDEVLVSSILSAVTKSVDAPVTLKIRTGWDKQNKNALNIARIAEDMGIAALTVHGRTRECRFKGSAEYDTIAQIAQSTSIPIIANGDIDSPQKAKFVLDYTQAQAIMIGRGAQGNPWLFREVNAYLDSGTLIKRPNLKEVETTVLAHLKDLHDFYGEYMGIRIARKHVQWYLQKQIHPIQGFTQNCPTSTHGDEKLLLAQEANILSKTLNPAGADNWRKHFNTLITKQKQLNAVRDLFDRLPQPKDQAA